MFARTRTTFLTASIAMLPGFVACGGDDPTGVQGDPLSEAEVQVVFAALAGAFSSVGTPSQAPADGPLVPSFAPVDVTQTFDLSSECVGGGTIAAGGSISGTTDDESFAMDLLYDLTLAPSGCTVADEETSIVVDGAPNIRIIMDILLNDLTLSVAGSYEGGIEYTTADGRAGSCGINLAFSVTANNSSGASEQSITGNVCGVSADQFEVYGTT
ncbi:MAG: hypothetical protein ACR2QM_19515 [Longimicrobiales bacterium]